MPSSIPPPQSRWEFPLTPLRPLLSVHPPPNLPDTLPVLPSPQRVPHIHSAFALSTHLVPAAHIRTTRHVPCPPHSVMPVPDTSTGEIKLTRDEKARRAIKVRAWLLDARATEAKHNVGHESVLWNCVNRYYRVDSGRGKTGGKGLTLFFAHANGFPKETWEPTLKYLLASSAHLIDEVWTWEAVQHGDAALVNGDALSSVYKWIDNARDILNFFTYFMPSSPFPGTTLPTHLPRIPAPESDQRIIRGFQTRTIVGIGHSFGGCTTALAALYNPHLFSSLILVDPVLTIPQWPGTPMPSFSPLLSLSALPRRNGWSSRSEALKLFQQNPFFMSWDPSVLRVYVECGLYSAPPSAQTPPGQSIKLKMPPIHESIVFDDTHSSCEAFANISNLDSRIRLRWIIPGVDNPEEMGPPGVLQQRIWQRPANSTNIKIPNAGHLIPQEKPKELADDIWDFLRETYSGKSFSKL